MYGLCIYGLPSCVYPEVSVLLYKKPHESLKKFIVNTYGSDIAKNFKRLSNLQRKKAGLLSSLKFLKICRDNGIIPSCVMLRNIFKTPQANKTFKETSVRLLRERIQNTRKELSSTDEEINMITTCIRKYVSDLHWNKLHNISQNHFQRFLEGRKANHKAKFQKLSNLRPKEKLKTVINLSTENIDSPTL